jgi:alginate O-acetyltransferase complex protein AlgI
VLFNSYEFLFVFLPLTLAIFFAIGRIGSQRAALAWLGLASLGFYSYWRPSDVLIVIGSITVNFAIGHRLVQLQGRSRPLLWLGVSANLALLGWFKYAAFFAVNANRWLGWQLPVFHHELPLGISFFTFTQIAFLVDAARGGARLYSPLRYSVFVLFFPHLIAGPIVHHHQLIPQLEKPAIFRFQSGPFSVGVTLFVLGLAKKVIFADNLAAIARPVFAAAAGGATPSFWESWGAALSYTLQLYFDFSGYSDMALGLARMFDLKFPVNFNSPYKATSIIDFWRRWHMTLSRFLRDYLYVPLGGSRCGTARKHLNLFITMTLGGLWHGAGWTFVLWGAWHGIALSVNHVWRSLWKADGSVNDSAVSMLAKGALTFAVVVTGWVLFRSHDLASAGRMLHGMASLGSAATMNVAAGLRAALVLAALYALVWFAPNSQQLLASWEPALDSPAPAGVQWQPSRGWAICITAVFVLAVLHLSQISEFIYFQF